LAECVGQAPYQWVGSPFARDVSEFHASETTLLTPSKVVVDLRRQAIPRLCLSHLLVLRSLTSIHCSHPITSTNPSNLPAGLRTAMDIYYLSDNLRTILLVQSCSLATTITRALMTPEGSLPQPPALISVSSYWFVSNDLKGFLSMKSRNPSPQCFLWSIFSRRRWLLSTTRADI
jgi:hypothetical protein